MKVVLLIKAVSNIKVWNDQMVSFLKLVVNYTQVCYYQMVSYLKLVVNNIKGVSAIQVSSEVVSIWDLLNKKPVSGWEHTDQAARKWKKDYPECEFAEWGH